MSLETKIIAAIRQAVDDGNIVAESEDDGGIFPEDGHKEFLANLYMELTEDERGELFSEWLIQITDGQSIIRRVCIGPEAKMVSPTIDLAEALLKRYQEHADQRITELEKCAAGQIESFKARRDQA